MNTAVRRTAVCIATIGLNDTPFTAVDYDIWRGYPR